MMYVISRQKIGCGSKLLFYRPNCSCFCKGQMLDWLQWKKQLDKKGNWQQVYLRSGAAIALCFYIPIPNVYVFQKKRFYSVIQSYFIIRDFLQNCKKSILVYQVLISLSLNVCTVPKSPCRISILPTSPSAFHWQYKPYIFWKCNFMCTSKLIDMFGCTLIN